MDFTSALNFNPELQKVFQSAVASTAEGITIADARKPDLPLIFVNKGFSDLTGYLPMEVLGKNCRFLQGPETSPAAIEVLREGLKKKTKVSVKLLNYKADGSTFWNRLALVPVMNPEGQCTHVEGIQSDVSQLVEAELMQANLEAMKKTITGVSGLVFNYMFFLQYFRESLPPANEANQALFQEFDARWETVRLKLEKLSAAKTLNDFEQETTELLDPISKFSG